VQPLVVVVFPILLVLGGRKRLLGLVLRGVVPAAAVTVGPLVGDFHATVHDVVTQPGLPDLQGNHQTPWTFLAPKLGGKGSMTAIGGGPTRAVALALAAALGWWARRWRERPEMLVWAVAVALALRIYTESVLTAYYVWPTLALGLVVAARGSRRLFAVSIAVAIGITIVAQFQLELFQWWALDIAGVTALLAVAARPEPLDPEQPQPERPRARAPAVPSSAARSAAATTAAAAKSKKTNTAKRKAARTDRKRSARR
jgi:hypothetical protein